MFGNQLKGEEAQPVFSKLSEIVALAFYFELIGVVYSICFFANFGLNYADYARIDDLLLGSFKEPAVFVAAFATVIYLIAQWRLKVSFLVSLFLLSLPVLLAGLMAIVAYHYVTRTDHAMPFSNTGTTVEVLLSEEFQFYYKDQKLSSVRLLGKSGKYFFFYDEFKHKSGVRKRSTIVLPESSIIQIARLTDAPVQNQ